MRHIAVVFARLIGIAVQHISDRGPIDLRIARHQGTQWNGTQIVRANAGQGAAISTKGGPDGVANEGLGDGAAHGLTLSLVF